MYTKLFVLLGLIALSFLAPLASETYASKLYLTPSGGSVPENTNLSFELKLDTQGEDVNAFSSIITYPADKLELISLSPTSIFSVQAYQSLNPGSIKLERGSFSAVKGDLSLAKFTFKVKKTGFIPVTINSNSVVTRYKDATNSLSSTLGGNYTITSNDLNATSTAKLNSNQPLANSCNQLAGKIQQKNSALLDKVAKMLERLDEISSKAQTLYTKKEQSNQSYGVILNEVLVKKDSVEKSILTMDRLMSEFNCDQKPKDKLQAIKNQSKFLKNNFLEYKSALKKLIKIL